MDENTQKTEFLDVEFYISLEYVLGTLLFLNFQLALIKQKLTS